MPRPPELSPDDRSPPAPPPTALPAAATEERQVTEESGPLGKKEGEPPIFGLGVSLGGVILANYLGQFGDQALVRGGVAFSTCYDILRNKEYQYSHLVWQQCLTLPMKKSCCLGRRILELQRKGVDLVKMRSSAVPSLLEFDTEVTAPMAGYPDVEAYYRDMGVAYEEKWRNVTLPLLAVNAADDPIMHCDCLRAEEFSKGNENLLFLITKKGGHVGWPWGWRPWRRGWDFMSHVSEAFILSLLPTLGPTDTIGGV